MTIQPTFKAAARLGLVFALTSLLVGCGAWTPDRAHNSPDRTVRRPHTAMRGPAYKRLILTLNESNQLNVRANEYADALEASGEVDPMTLLDARQLADDVAQFADDVEWSLANNQRMQWHRSRMDELWDTHVDLYPQDEAFADSYRTKDMRKRSFKIQLKQAYKERWNLDFEKARDQVMERQRQDFLESL